MAKRTPTLNLAEMEKALGYDTHSLYHFAEPFKRFYSDLRPIAHSGYERTRREFEEMQKKIHSRQDGDFPEDLVRKLERTQMISHDRNRVVLTQTGLVGFYRFAVDIRYDFGLHVPLLFNEDEACRTLSVAKAIMSTKLPPRKPHKSVAKPQSCKTHMATSWFFKFPQEIRGEIYAFAVSDGTWCIEDVDVFDKFSLTRAIGDQSGFYFPLSKRLGILSVNKQMRQEALPLAYGLTTFHLDDMDDLLKLFIMVGKMGRDNIEAIYFSWESRSDLECKWEENPHLDNHSLTLPSLHAMECVQMLKQCKRLRSLRLYFERDLIEQIAPEVFKTNPSIAELRSIHIKKVEVWSPAHESLEHCSLVSWLREGMECSRTLGQGNKGVGWRNRICMAPLPTWT
ncbi:hypothetical protein CC80DRAFT_193879 [Byssothecium circinans]|uniref:Uncharacterized protein n=1 Tax=Byssothecium circinans TaxID=147558 RepID=A0A6A5UCU1_9PLEO|nr:hypothetical protein CC80DRAFT_193879 [Byssothecium circinans]